MSRRTPVVRRGGRGPSATGPGLAVRLLVAIALVIVAGAATVVLVSVLVAPAVFHRHLLAAGIALSSEANAHVDDAFAVAILAGLAAGVTAAAAVAIAVALVVARRISEPVAVAAATAQRLADGDYGARMSPPRMGPELSALAGAMNALAVRLDGVERHREQLMIDVAHELRTPLASLRATVEALADGVLPADAQTLASLSEQTARLTRLTGDLAAVSRSQEHAFTVHRRRVDLTGLAQDCTTAHAAAYAAAGVALTGPAGAPPAVAQVDPDRVTEILDQLLHNALAHCAGGDDVSVTVAPPSAGAGEPVATMVVRDTGAGFDPVLAEALFARFYREPRPGQPAIGEADQGSGVGLTIARALAEAHGGTLTASSPGPGQGATFTLTLPAPGSPYA